MNRAYRLQEMEKARQRMLAAPDDVRLQRQCLTTIIHHAHFAAEAPYTWLISQVKQPESPYPSVTPASTYHCPQCPDDHPGFPSQNSLNAHKRAHIVTRKGGTHA